MQNNKFKCGLCDQPNFYGPHVYDFISIKSYGLMVCKSCFDTNWDGWNPQFESRLLTSLNDNNLPVPSKLNNGLFPRT